MWNSKADHLFLIKPRSAWLLWDWKTFIKVKVACTQVCITLGLFHHSACLLRVTVSNVRPTVTFRGSRDCKWRKPVAVSLRAATKVQRPWQRGCGGDVPCPCVSVSVISAITSSTVVTSRSAGPRSLAFKPVSWLERSTDYTDSKNAVPLHQISSDEARQPAWRSKWLVFHLPLSIFVFRDTRSVLTKEFENPTRKLKFPWEHSPVGDRQSVQNMECFKR